MSQVYSTEPPTSGRVVIGTSHGPIDVNLWCKECPAATRSFLQLCLDGYYDATAFHRIMGGFLIQAGKLRHQVDGGGGGGAGGGRLEEDEPADMESYRRNTPGAGGGCGLAANGEGRPELSGRLRFNHRGQVACALPVEEYGGGKGDTAEGSSLYRQFFVTLDEAPFLDGYVENRSGLADVDADGRTERSVLVFVRGRTVPRLRRDRVAEAFSIFRRYGCHRSHLSFGD